MRALPPRPTSAGLRLQARRNLRGTVINIEMTLISVLVGVNLAPLMESATPLVRTVRFDCWPYVLASLLLIVWIWTGVITPSLTFISLARDPVEQDAGVWDRDSGEPGLTHRVVLKIHICPLIL